MRHLQPVLDRVLDVLKTHELEHPGEYTRWLWQNEANDRKLGLNEYGCADAANILYMLGCFRRTAKTVNAGSKRCSLSSIRIRDSLLRRRITRITPLLTVSRRWNSSRQKPHTR